MGGKREGRKNGEHVPRRGFYSSCYKARESADLEEIPPEGLGEEINMLRVSMRRAMELAKRAKTLEERMSQMDALSAAGLRLAGMVRVQDQIHGKDSGFAAELDQAIAEVNKELGIK